MSYEQYDRSDRNSSDRNNHGAIAGIARDAYEPSNGKWNWNLNTQDSAAGTLPNLTLTSGSSGEGAAMQNAALPGQNSSSSFQGEGSWMQNAAAPGQNSPSNFQGEGSWMQNAAAPEQNSSSPFSGATGDAGTANSTSTQATDSQSVNQQNLPAELQQLEAGIQQQLQQLGQEISQLQTELGIPSQTAAEAPATPSQTASPGTGVGDTMPTPVSAPASPEASQTPVPPVEATSTQTSSATQQGSAPIEAPPPVASTAPQTTAPTDAPTPVASTTPQTTAPSEAPPVAGTSTQTALPATDVTIQGLQTTDPQAAQLLTAMEPSTSGMTQAGFNQYETNFNQNIQTGQYADVASAANAAAVQLQNSGDAADASIAGNVISNNINGSNDATLSTYNTNNDPIIQALQQSNPQAAQILTELQPSQSGMLAGGYSQLENNFNQNIQGGQYPDIASAANAAVTQLQNSGDTTDAAAATTIINNNIAAYGDAALSTYNQESATAGVSPISGDSQAVGGSNTASPTISGATGSDIATGNTTTGNTGSDAASEVAQAIAQAAAASDTSTAGISYPDPSTNPSYTTELAALNTADPQLIQMISQMQQSGMSEAGLSTVVNGVYSKWWGHDYNGGGQYTSPVYTDGNTANTGIMSGLEYEFNNNGPEGTLSSSDNTIFNNAVASVIAQDGNDEAINTSIQN
jgi:hypothetical protein